MKCMICKKANGEVYKMRTQYGPQPDADVAVCEPCRETAKKRYLDEGMEYKDARDRFEQRIETAQKKLVKKAGGYLRKDGTRFWPWANPPAGAATPSEPQGDAFEWRCEHAERSATTDALYRRRLSLMIDKRSYKVAIVGCMPCLDGEGWRPLARKALERFLRSRN